MDLIIYVYKEKLSTVLTTVMSSFEFDEILRKSKRRARSKCRALLWTPDITKYLIGKMKEKGHTHRARKKLSSQDMHKCYKYICISKVL